MASVSEQWREQLQQGLQQTLAWPGTLAGGVGDLLAFWECGREVGMDVLDRGSAAEVNAVLKVEVEAAEVEIDRADEGKFSVGQCELRMDEAGRVFVVRTPAAVSAS